MSYDIIVFFSHDDGFTFVTDCVFTAHTAGAVDSVWSTRNRADMRPARLRQALTNDVYTVSPHVPVPGTRDSDENNPGPSFRRTIKSRSATRVSRDYKMAHDDVNDCRRYVYRVMAVYRENNFRFDIKRSGVPRGRVTGGGGGGEEGSTGRPRPYPDATLSRTR